MWEPRLEPTSVSFQITLLYHPALLKWQQGIREMGPGSGPPAHSSWLPCSLAVYLWGSYFTSVSLNVLFFLNILFIMLLCYYAITVVPLPLPLIPLCSAHLLPPTFPPFSSCPWVMYISSLVSTFPILFLTSPYFLPTIYATYSLYIFPLSPPPTPPLITLHVISISVVLFLF